MADKSQKKKSMTNKPKLTTKEKNNDVRALPSQA